MHQLEHSEVIKLTSLQMALEEYVKQVKETWTSYTLDLVNYQNKCRLIRYMHSDNNPNVC
jgi:hypothetical protein